MRTAAETLARLEEIFEAIIAFPPGCDQAAEARRLSGGDAELERQALSLAAAHLRRETLNGASKEAVQAEEEAGRIYGRYSTVRRIGAGGMGTVFLAERADGEYRQTVALKVIHPHLRAEVFHRRFLEERQILATLNHPGITKILDGGITSDGAPYLVMDYVEGEPPDVFCAQHGLDLRARLDLFRNICEPVAYAHRSLVIHRDLKPSNILVTAEGNPVLLDFGTARFVETISQTEHTAFPLLTLRYSSPEQRSRGHLTTATDVYSLGVILYELLTGEWPFGDASSPEGLIKAFSRERQITAPGLAGDLRAILSKALAGRAEDRYSSVEAFAGDVKNFLRGAPVTAKPERWGYRARKFVRRNIVTVTFSVIAVAALIAATGSAVYQARLARERYAALRSVTTSLLFDLKNAINDVPGSTRAQKILIDRVLKNLGDLRLASPDPDLQFQLAEAYRQLGELQGDPYSQNLGDSAGALESLGKGRTIIEAAVRRGPLNAAWLHLAGMMEITMAETHLGRGAGAANAAACAKNATAYYERMIPLTKNGDWLADAASAYGVFGDIEGQAPMSMADPVKAAQEYRRAIELDKLGLAASPGSARALRGTAVMRMKLGDLVRPRDPQSALDEFRAASLALEGISSAEKSSPTIRRVQFTLLRKTGDALRDMQEWAEAESALRRVRAYHDQQLSADPGDKRAAEDVAVIASDQAYLYLWQRKYREMLEPAATLNRLSEEFLRREPNNTKWQLYSGVSQVQLAIAEVHAGGGESGARRARAGVRELIRVAEGRETSPKFHQVAAEWLVLAEPKTESDPQRAVVYARKFLAETRPDNVAGLFRLALALQAAGQAREARAAAGAALSLLAPVRGNHVPYMRKVLETL